MKIKNKKRCLRFLYFFIFFSGIISFFSYLDKKIVPPLKEISHMQCKMLANRIIDISAEKIISDMNMTEAKLLVPTVNGEGYTANTVLINSFCTKFNSAITDDLMKIHNEKIYIPLGAVTNWSFFASKGPKIPFTLLPMGAAKTDYETEFLSVGINQINYKIWLNISIELKIVNPLYHENISLERKIMLADIVFSGKVPEHFFQMLSPGEYLLTE